MPRYLVERLVSEETQQDMPGFGSNMKQAAIRQFPDISWEHSHVVSDEETIKTFCVYEAPNPEMVREHALVVGGHVIGHLYEIAADVTPADFPG